MLTALGSLKKLRAHPSQANVFLRTMLRFPPADNDVVEIAQPMIEGFVRDLGEWSVGVDRLVGLQVTGRER